MRRTSRRSGGLRNIIISEGIEKATDTDVTVEVVTGFDRLSLSFDREPWRDTLAVCIKPFAL